MPDEPFSNREIKEMFTDVKKDLTDIKVQTTTTNGRVSKLENWRWFITGCVTIIGIVVLPILGWALYILVTINSEVHSAVDQALSAYNIQVK